MPLKKINCILPRHPSFDTNRLQTPAYGATISSDMSLLERVTSFESLAPERGRSPSGSEGSRDGKGRKLSFSPMPGACESPVAVESQQPIGAFEIPYWERVLQVTIAVIYCLFAAGIVFGYAALKPVLIREGVYRNRCTPDEIKRDVRTCYDQELHLNRKYIGRS